MRTSNGKLFWAVTLMALLAIPVSFSFAADADRERIAKGFDQQIAHMRRHLDAIERDKRFVVEVRLHAERAVADNAKRIEAFQNNRKGPENMGRVYFEAQSEALSIARDYLKGISQQEPLSDPAELFTDADFEHAVEDYVTSQLMSGSGGGGGGSGQDYCISGSLCPQGCPEVISCSGKPPCSVRVCRCNNGTELKHRCAKSSEVLSDSAWWWKFFGF